jgi:PEP-CTERM motif
MTTGWSTTRPSSRSIFVLEWQLPHHPRGRRERQWPRVRRRQTFRGSICFVVHRPSSFDATPDEFDVALDSATEDIGSSFNFLQVKGAIPEPSTWAMMLLGFAALGYVGYRKGKQAAIASF